MLIERGAIIKGGEIKGVSPPTANAKVSCVMLAGGGMNTGQGIGKTNRMGIYAIDRPVKFQEVFATLYHNIGLDLNGTRLFDTSGTPQSLVDQGIEPIRKLI